jgi:hypothetical protein
MRGAYGYPTSHVKSTVHRERTCMLREREIEVRVDGRRRGAKSGTKSFVQVSDLNGGRRK